MHFVPRTYGAVLLSSAVSCTVIWGDRGRESGVWLKAALDIKGVKGIDIKGLQQILLKFADDRTHNSHP